MGLDADPVQLSKLGNETDQQRVVPERKVLTMKRRGLLAGLVSATMLSALIVPDAARATTNRSTKKAKAKTTKPAAVKTTRKAKSAGPSLTVKAPSAATATVGGCPVFPPDNPWNTDVSRFPIHPRSEQWVAAVNAGGKTLHPDTGANPAYGIPYVVVPANQAQVPVTYTEFGDESDPGPFPIPTDAPIESGSDRHVLVVQSGTCQLFELFNARKTSGGWEASSGAKFDLRSNALRPAGWTSADAAGLPILPGLLRYDEVAAGEIRHALRFTAPTTQRAYILPARHFAGIPDDRVPPMGARFRLRSNVDLSGYRGHALVILRALQRYGMIVADNGSSWFISGATDARWNDADLGQLKTVPGAWFEVVDTGAVVTAVGP